VHPPQASQGDVVTVEITSQSPGTSATSPELVLGDVDHREKPSVYNVFFADGNREIALLGIDAEAKPGKRPLAVRWQGGETNAWIQIKAKKFPTERLTVEPKYVEPPAEVVGRILAEKDRLDQLWRQAGSERLWHQPFVRPIDGVPNSAFGLQRILNGERRSPHGGVDFPAQAGLPVHAANAGRIALAEELYFTGNTVVIDHGLGLYTVYAHLSEIDVRVGDLVPEGRVIGRVGATGRATGPHLHWGARLLEARVDPMQLLNIESEDDHGARR
jgi:murein DD-endopeptidase MepM/ murein hydrolase activator NlpD